MAEVNLRDAAVWHKILMEGQKQRLGRQASKKLNELLKDLKKAIKNRDENNINQLQEKVSDLIEQYYNQLSEDFIEELEPVLEYETEFQGRFLDEVIKREVEETGSASSLLGGLAGLAAAGLIANRVSQNERNQIITQSRVRGATFSERINQQKNQLKELVRRGLIIGDDDEMNDAELIDNVASIVGSNRQRTEQMLRTVVNAHTNEVANETFRKNGLRYYRYIAVLDARTTDICRGLNNTIYEIGKGRLPPQHYGCRSFTAPVVKNGEGGFDTFDNFLSRNNDSRLKKSEKGGFKDEGNFNMTLNQAKGEDLL